MNYNWNVYKIFNNGKRAKAPFISFECAENKVEAFFEKNIKIDLDEKLQLGQFTILRADLSQHRKFEEEEQEREKEQKDKEKDETKRFKITTHCRLCHC